MKIILKKRKTKKRSTINMRLLCFVKDHPDLEEICVRRRVRVDQLKDRADFLKEQYRKLNKEAEEAGESFWEEVRSYLKKNKMEHDSLRFDGTALKELFIVEEGDDPHPFEALFKALKGIER
jgi:hypothetical protein